MSPENLINGEKPEFGNPAHIQWLQRKEKWDKEMLSGNADLYSEEVELQVHVEVKFPCIQCRNEISFSRYEYDTQNIEIAEVIGMDLKRCKSCGCEYHMNRGEIVLSENPYAPDRVTKLPEPRI